MALYFAMESSINTGMYTVAESDDVRASERASKKQASGDCPRVYNIIGRIRSERHSKAEAPNKGFDCPQTKNMCFDHAHKSTHQHLHLNTGIMDALQEALKRETELAERFCWLLQQVELASASIINDPNIQHALNPNNECTQFSEPIDWDGLLKKSIRMDYFRRKLRFEPE